MCGRVFFVSQPMLLKVEKLLTFPLETIEMTVAYCWIFRSLQLVCIVSEGSLFHVSERKQERERHSTCSVDYIFSFIFQDTV